jgi:putative membrane protein
MRISSVPIAVCSLALTAATAGAAPLSHADKQFMIMAARTDMLQAHEGQMAASQTTRTDVKALAEAVVQDYTESYRQLTALAANTGVSIPKGIDAAKDPRIGKLAHLKGPQLERQFALDEVAASKQVISAFKLEAARGRDARLKAYANGMISSLKKDLHLAEDCAKPTRRT